MTFRQSAVVSSDAVASGLVNLKQAAVFFDKVHVIEADFLIEKELPAIIGQDYDFLSERELLTHSDWRTEASTGDEANILAERVKSAVAASLFTGQENVPLYRSYAGGGLVRLAAARLSRIDPDHSYVPITQTANYMSKLAEITPGIKVPGPDPTRRVMATSWTFKEVPAPSTETPWEDIFDYRNSSDTSGHCLQLRRWIRENANAENERELVESLRHDLAILEDRLKRHGMRAVTTRVETTLPFLNLLGNFLTLRFGEVLKPFLGVTKSELDINEAEASLKAQPLYMLADLNRRFA